MTLSVHPEETFTATNIGVRYSAVAAVGVRIHERLQWEGQQS